MKVPSYVRGLFLTKLTHAYVGTWAVFDETENYLTHALSMVRLPDANELMASRTAATFKMHIKKRTLPLMKNAHLLTTLS